MLAALLLVLALAACSTGAEPVSAETEAANSPAMHVVEWPRSTALTRSALRSDAS